MHPVQTNKRHLGLFVAAQYVIGLFLGAVCLDGGILLRVAVVSIGIHLFTTGMILWRRRLAMTRGDELVIGLGYLVLFFGLYGWLRSHQS